MKYMTAGESHGKGLVAILDGVPSNLKVNLKEVNRELKRRQQGYGRGGRMKIESDSADFMSGIRDSVTLGSPISFIVWNADYKNWQPYMDAQSADVTKKCLTKVRPGHADLSGCIKYAFKDARNILERASARETAAKVGVGAICKQLLKAAGISIGSHVVQIGDAISSVLPPSAVTLNKVADASVVRCLDAVAEKEMIKNIDGAMALGDTLGGQVEVIVDGVPVGVGSHAQFDRKLDYMICGHLGALQAVKSVSIGDGELAKSVFGSGFHDEIVLGENGKAVRTSNRAGGIEGGISNGERIVVRLNIKPIPTLMKGLNTIDIQDGTKTMAAPERSDCCAVPAAGVVAEAILAFVLADAIMACTGGDTTQEFVSRVNNMRKKEKLIF